MLQREEVVVWWNDGESAFTFPHLCRWFIQCIEHISWLVKQTLTINDRQDNLTMATSPNIHDQQPQAGCQSAICFSSLTSRSLVESGWDYPLSLFRVKPYQNQQSDQVWHWYSKIWKFSPSSFMGICLIGLLPHSLVQFWWDFPLWIPKHRLYQVHWLYYAGHCYLKSWKFSPWSTITLCFLGITPQPLVKSQWKHPLWLTQVSLIHEQIVVCNSVRNMYLVASTNDFILLSLAICQRYWWA